MPGHRLNLERTLQLVERRLMHVTWHLMRDLNPPRPTCPAPSWISEEPEEMEDPDAAFMQPPSRAAMGDAFTGPLLLPSLRETFVLLEEDGVALPSPAWHPPKSLSRQANGCQSQPMPVPVLEPVVSQHLDFHIWCLDLQRQLGLPNPDAKSLAHLIPRVPLRCPRPTYAERHQLWKSISRTPQDSRTALRVFHPLPTLPEEPPQWEEAEAVKTEEPGSDPQDKAAHPPGLDTQEPCVCLPKPLPCQAPRLMILPEAALSQPAPHADTSLQPSFQQGSPETQPPLAHGSQGMDLCLKETPSATQAHPWGKPCSAAEPGKGPEHRHHPLNSYRPLGCTSLQGKLHLLAPEPAGKQDPADTTVLPGEASTKVPDPSEDVCASQELLERHLMGKQPQEVTEEPGPASCRMPPGAETDTGKDLSHPWGTTNEGATTSIRCLLPTPVRGRHGGRERWSLEQPRKGTQLPPAWHPRGQRGAPSAQPVAAGSRELHQAGGQAPDLHYICGLEGKPARAVWPGDSGQLGARCSLKELQGPLQKITKVMARSPKASTSSMDGAGRGLQHSSLETSWERDQLVSQLPPGSEISLGTDVPLSQTFMPAWRHRPASVLPHKPIHKPGGESRMGPSQGRHPDSSQPQHGKATRASSSRAVARKSLAGTPGDTKRLPRERGWGAGPGPWPWKEGGTKKCPVGAARPGPRPDHVEPPDLAQLLGSILTSPSAHDLQLQFVADPLKKQCPQGASAICPHQAPVRAAFSTQVDVQAQDQVSAHQMSLSHRLDAPSGPAQEGPPTGGSRGTWKGVKGQAKAGTSEQGVDDATKVWLRTSQAPDGVFQMCGKKQQRKPGGSLGPGDFQGPLEEPQHSSPGDPLRPSNLDQKPLERGSQRQDRRLRRASCERPQTVCVSTSTVDFPQQMDGATSLLATKEKKPQTRTPSVPREKVPLGHRFLRGLQRTFSKLCLTMRARLSQDPRNKVPNIRLTKPPLRHQASKVAPHWHLPVPTCLLGGTPRNPPSPWARAGAHPPGLLLGHCCLFPSALQMGTHRLPTVGIGKRWYTSHPTLQFHHLQVLPLGTAQRERVHLASAFHPFQHGDFLQHLRGYKFQTSSMTGLQHCALTCWQWIDNNVSFHIFWM
ncbi:uncharacterized protein LOC132244131 isoform X2 [Alligator mississippiensis]|nr:uncharacterized protein LOC132244131 isoform X2 [Alligator mississippiensis]